MEDLYPCIKCKNLYEHGNILKSYDQDNVETSDFYCNDCFFTKFEIKENEECQKVE